jgi:acyl-coenzyme A thioesterase PaaI-like protein
MHPSVLRAGFNLWPPFLFAGVHVTHLSADWRHARVELRARPWNRNYVGTHFGGSLFAMTDPFWMILILRALGRDYIVWDKAAEIEFVKPGRGTVHARFDLDDATLARIRAATAQGEKHLLWLPVEVLNAQGELVARVRKQVYIRRKPAARGAPSEPITATP